jgi:hypothetical protein
LKVAHGKEADFQYQYGTALVGNTGTALVGTNKFDEGLQALKAAVVK